MILSESAQISLDLIRHFVEKQHYDLNGVQKMALKEVYEEIQTNIGKPKILDTSCSGCIKTAVNICKNFVDFHEERRTVKALDAKPSEPAKVERKSVSDSIDERVDLKQLTIPELQDICKEQGIKFHHKAKEATLIELILNKQNEEVPE